MNPYAEVREMVCSSGVIARIYRPDLTEEERNRRMENIKKRAEILLAKRR